MHNEIIIKFTVDSQADFDLSYRMCADGVWEPEYIPFYKQGWKFRTNIGMDTQGWNIFHKYCKQYGIGNVLIHATAYDSHGCVLSDMVAILVKERVDKAPAI